MSETRFRKETVFYHSIHGNPHSDWLAAFSSLTPSALPFRREPKLHSPSISTRFEVLVGAQRRYIRISLRSTCGTPTASVYGNISPAQFLRYFFNSTFGVHFTSLGLDFRPSETNHANTLQMNSFSLPGDIEKKTRLFIGQAYLTSEHAF